MKNKITIMSREEAEQLISDGFPDHTAVICFFDPQSGQPTKDYVPVNYSKACDPVFSVPIHDIDIESLSEFGLTFDTFFPEADSLAQYIIQCVTAGYDILCQCEYGQSRSAACAAAIKEFFDQRGIEIFADYRYYPNQLIFNKLLAALKDVSSHH